MSNVNVFFETNFETDLKNELSKKNYNNCIAMLNDEIRDFYVNKIKKYNKYFKFTNMLDLLTMSQEYLSTKETQQLKKYYIINTRNYSTSCELYTLLNIYNELEKIS